MEQTNENCHSILKKYMTTSILYAFKIHHKKRKFPIQQHRLHRSSSTINSKNQKDVQFVFLIYFYNNHIRPVKKLSDWVLACLFVWSKVQTCIIKFMAQLPLTISCFSKIQIGFYRAMLCIRGTSHGPVSVSVCLCLCVCHKTVFY